MTTTHISVDDSASCGSGSLDAVENKENAGECAVGTFRAAMMEHFPTLSKNDVDELVTVLDERNTGCIPLDVISSKLTESLASALKNNEVVAFESELQRRLNDILAKQTQNCNMVTTTLDSDNSLHNDSYEDYGDSSSEVSFTHNRPPSSQQLANGHYRSSGTASPDEEQLMELTDKVRKLEQSLGRLSDDSVIARLKTENSSLKQQLEMTRDQLQETEYQLRHLADESEQRIREITQRSERDKESEVSHLNARLTRLQRDYDSLFDSEKRLRSDCDKLLRDKSTLLEENNQLKYDLRITENETSKLTSELSGQRGELEKTRDESEKIVGILNSELEQLQLFKSRTENLGDVDRIASKLEDFEIEIRQLKEDNKGLRDRNDDLQYQLLSHGKDLLASTAQSIAAEFDQSSKDEVLTALKEQQEVNKYLKSYIDVLILTILDHNPNLLDITNKKLS